MKFLSSYVCSYPGPVDDLNDVNDIVCIACILSFKLSEILSEDFHTLATLPVLIHVTFTQCQCLVFTEYTICNIAYRLG